ncbi:MAG: hypothetical protein ACRDHD_08635 [Candidatus Limnocylindria bacterium]
MAAMARGADAVVVGHFTGIRDSRVIQGDAPQDRVGYAAADVLVSELLLGQLPTDNVPLEFLLTAPGDPVDQVSELGRSLPTGESVLFLREKGGAEASLFRVVNSNGLWTATTRAPLDTPLAADEPASSKLYAAELAGIQTLAEFIDAVRQLR